MFLTTRMPRVFTAVLPAIAVLLIASIASAETYELQEPQPETRTFEVETICKVKGKLLTPQREGKVSELPLDVTARLNYRERRLSGRGRDALGFRSARAYETAQADIKVAEQQSSARLRDDRRLLVAQNEREGVQFYAPGHLLNFNETELLKTPVDPLPLHGILPIDPVEPGDEWTPETWVAQSLVGVDALLEQELTCKLDKIKGRTAIVSLSGTLKGAHLGANTEVKLTGEFTFDLDQNTIVAGTFKQTENRDVGAVSPGLDLTATMTFTRKVVSDVGRLTDGLVDTLPLDPEPEQLRLEFLSPWKLRFEHSRNWHVFQQTSRVAVVRLMIRGNLISQFNVSPIASVKAGSRTPRERFLEDIGRSLGDQLVGVDGVDDITLPNGVKVLKVAISGKARDIEMDWIYYLCTAQDGRQAAFVFAAEKALSESFGEKHLELVKTISFE